MRVRFAFLAVFLCVVRVDVSVAQDVDIRTVESSSEGVVVEITVDWPASMQALVDSAAIEAFTVSTARMLSFGLPAVSETIELPSKNIPDLSLLASAYDELDLPVGDTLVAQETSSPVVWLDGLGTSQGRHLINLGVRLLVYEDGVVRRYRQVRAAVRYASGAGRPSDGFPSRRIPPQRQSAPRR